MNEARWRRLAALLEPFHEQAVGTARRLSRSTADGDDLYQETVLRAFDKLDTLRDESKFRSWFFVTLLSRHRSRARRSFWKRMLPWEAAFPDGLEPAGADGSRWGEQTIETRRMTAALATLPPEQREAIVLFELGGFSIEEIAAMQQVSLSAIKSRLVRGRERLRRHYERLGLASTESSHLMDAAPAVARMTSMPRLIPTPVVGKERSHE